jgi:hypothetical protein
MCIQSLHLPLFRQQTRLLVLNQPQTNNQTLDSTSYYANTPTYNLTLEFLSRYDQQRAQQHQLITQRALPEVIFEFAVDAEIAGALRVPLSTLSTFTRPPTSSLQPDGSTVWANPLIASYLPRSTPSNETYLEEEEQEGGILLAF